MINIPPEPKLYKNKEESILATVNEAIKELEHAIHTKTESTNKEVILRTYGRLSAIKNFLQ